MCILDLILELAETLHLRIDKALEYQLFILEVRCPSRVRILLLFTPANPESLLESGIPFLLPLRPESVFQQPEVCFYWGNPLTNDRGFRI